MELRALGKQPPALDRHQCGASEIRQARIALLQARAGQIGTLKAGFLQVGKVEAGVAQVGTAQVGAAEVHVAQVLVAQVSAFEIGAGALAVGGDGAAVDDQGGVVAVVGVGGRAVSNSRRGKYFMAGFSL